MGKIEFKELKEGEKLKTMNGKELSIHIKDGKVSVNGAIIQQQDVKTSNGVIHSLDTVLRIRSCTLKNQPFYLCVWFLFLCMFFLS
jgi:uncharacterized surface protein with fasciclin (FAS1) repeats